MDEKKDYAFGLLLSVCLITIAIEMGLLLWSNHVISQVGYNNQTVVTIQLASKGVMTYVTLLFGSLITTSVSIIVPQFRVFALYNEITDKRFRRVATVAIWAYVLVPVINTVGSIIGGYTLLQNAGLSLFDILSL